MKRIAMFVAAGAMVVAVPALAAKPPHPTHPVHPTHPTHPAKSCTALNKGYSARGTLASAATLMAATKKGFFNGSLTVNVTRANHKAPTGPPAQMFTLTNARVRFGKGVTATTTAMGDPVVLHGKITELPHGCPTTGFTSTITVNNVAITAPKS